MLPDGKIITVNIDAPNHMVRIMGLSYFNNELVTLTRAECSGIHDILTTIFQEDFK
jgi:hypothetical protein